LSTKRHCVTIVHALDLGAVEFRRLTESNFHGVEVVDRPVTRRRICSAPPPSHLIFSFSAQSQNFSLRLIDQMPDVGL